MSSTHTRAPHVLHFSPHVYLSPPQTHAGLCPRCSPRHVHATPSTHASHHHTHTRMPSHRPPPPIVGTRAHHLQIQYPTSCPQPLSSPPDPKCIHITPALLCHRSHPPRHIALLGEEAPSGTGTPPACSQGACGISQGHLERLCDILVDGRNPSAGGQCAQQVGMCRGH